MPYTDLVPQLSFTVATDGSTVYIQDNTGTYPESPGGYAPAGQGTATRPEASQVYKWLIWREAPTSDILLQDIPPSAVETPYTLTRLDNEGVPAPDTIYQVLLCINSVDGDDYNTILTEAYNSGDAWQFFMDYFYNEPGGNPVAMGQGICPVAITATNCVNASRFEEVVYPEVSGKCDGLDDFMVRNGLLIGMTANITMALSYPINSETGNDYFNEANAELDTLNSRLCPI